MTTKALELEETSNRVRVTALDMNDRLKRLRQKVQQTREVANKVRVGVDFEESTTLQVVPPMDPTESATSTKVTTGSTIISYFPDLLA